MQLIDEIYKKASTNDKEEKRNLVRNALQNAVIMTNYGKKTFYRIIEVQFKRMQDVPIDENTNMLQYYEKKYSIVIQNPKQPLLLAENKVKRKQTNGTEQPTYLVPQLCLMTGIPDNFDESRRKSVSQNTILHPNDKFR